MNQDNLLYDIFCKIFLLRVAPSKAAIPNNILDLFGVFVTIYRIPEFNHGESIKNLLGKFEPVLFDASLDKDKMQVHGCVGYMHPNMQRVAPKEIYDHAINVGVDAARHDSRRTQFYTAIEHDPFSLLHISYLRRPVEKMNPKNSNDEYGIICHSNNGLTTFLPKVFLGSKLGQITNDLVKKAGASCLSFYQYKVFDFETSFYSLMIDTLQRQVNLFAAQLDLYFYNNDFVFYERLPDGSTRVDKSEIVRNMACLDCISKLPVSPPTAAAVKRNMEELQNFATLRKNLSSHEKISLTKKYNQALCQENFYEKISDTEFELGQYGIHYTKFCDRNNLNKKITLFLILDKLQDAEIKQSSIFRLNWYCQMLWTTLETFIKEQGVNKKYLNDSVSGFLSKHADYISKSLLSFANRPNFGTSYTNVLAVSLEAFCFILDICKTLNMQKRCQEIINVLFYVFVLLEQRCRFFTMFPFDDGTCRLDISCHVYNGINVFLKMVT